MNKKFKNYFMSIAKMTAELSYAERKKVGAVLVRDRRIVLCGYNGTPSGFDNKCEDELGMTKPNVLHAEENMIIYAAKNGIPLHGSILFVTMSPCPVCARLIYGAGIVHVYYNEDYRDTSGIDFLKSVGVGVTLI